MAIASETPASKNCVRPESSGLKAIHLSLNISKYAIFFRDHSTAARPSQTPPSTHIYCLAIQLEDGMQNKQVIPVAPTGCRFPSFAPNEID